MAKRIILVLVVVLLVAGIGSYVYAHYRTDRRMNGGEVVDETGGITTADGTAPVKAPTRSETTDSAVNDTTGRTAAQMGAADTRTGTQPVTVVQPVVSGSPATDSIAPNPPNRAAFAGKGKFQVYRQGDLTWRINTDSGRTCILFATEEQWRKPVVYRNACGND